CHSHISFFKSYNRVLLDIDFAKEKKSFIIFKIYNFLKLYKEETFFNLRDNKHWMPSTFQPLSKMQISWPEYKRSWLELKASKIYKLSLLFEGQNDPIFHSAGLVIHSLPKKTKGQEGTNV
ncbi:hypothetical protein ACJX0J_019587, partial [Zea mays]